MRFQPIHVLKFEIFLNKTFEKRVSQIYKLFIKFSDLRHPQNAKQVDSIISQMQLQNAYRLPTFETPPLEIAKNADYNSPYLDVAI
jgi:hypothetical protein